MTRATLARRDSDAQGRMVTAAVVTRRANNWPAVPPNRSRSGRIVGGSPAPPYVLAARAQFVARQLQRLEIAGHRQQGVVGFLVNAAGGRVSRVTARLHHRYARS